MAQGRAARADLRRAGQGAGPEERPQGAAQAGQGRRLGRDRDRLRPRGRADRARGARGDARREPQAAQRVRRSGAAGRQARPLLGADQGGDRGGVRQPRRAVRAAGPRRRGAPGHRPDLGRDADALRLARDRPPRLAVPVRRPCAEPDARDRGRARAGAPRARPEALLGGVRRLRASRRRVHRAPQGGQVLGGGRGEGRAREHDAAPASVKSVESKRNTRKPPAPFNTTAFTSAASSVGVSPARAMRIAEDLYMDGFISYPRTDNTVYPKSLPVRELLQSISQVPAFKEAAPLADARRARADARQEGDHRPPADLPDAGARPERAARRRPPQDLRAGRAPLPGDVRRPVGVGVDARRHRGRLRDLLRARQRAGRARASSRSIHTARSKDEEIPKVEEGQELRARRARACAPARAEDDASGPRRTRGSTRRRPSRRRASARAS